MTRRFSGHGLWRSAVRTNRLQPAVVDRESPVVVFEWTTNRLPPEEQFFELIFWKEGEDPLRSGLGISDATRAMRAEVDLRVLDDLRDDFRPGVYVWGIALVEKNPYRRMHFITNNPRRFNYSP